MLKFPFSQDHNLKCGGSAGQKVILTAHNSFQSISCIFLTPIPLSAEHPSTSAPCLFVPSLGYLHLPGDFMWKSLQYTKTPSCPVPPHPASSHSVTFEVRLPPHRSPASHHSSWLTEFSCLKLMRLKS